MKQVFCNILEECGKNDVALPSFEIQADIFYES